MSQTPTKSDRGSPPSTPRWVKVFGIIAIVLVLVFVTLHLTGNSLGGDHMQAIQQWLQQLWR
jgi:hypothetical protein